MTHEIYLKVGNDIGNSEHDITINGDIIQQPHVYARVAMLEDLFLETEHSGIIRDIHNNIVVSIQSHSVAPSYYFIGEYAVKSGHRLRNIVVGAENSKVDSDVAIICTLGQIAAYAVKKAYQENKKATQIKANVDMVTSIPVSQYNKTNVSKLLDNFTNGTHIVKFYCGNRSFDVTINFEYIKVLPESIPIIFYLQSLTPATIEKTEDAGLKKMLQSDMQDIFNEFNELYKDKLQKPIDGTFLLNKKIQHVSIGEGTTEYPQTNDISFDPNFIRGTNHGVGHATKSVLDRFIREKNLLKFSRQEFSKIMIDEKNKYHEDAMEMMEIPLEEQGLEILENTKDEVAKANNAVDIIAVHGGGSILMRKALYDRLLEFANKIDAYLFYAPKKYAVTLESKGLYAFANSAIFHQLKKKHM